MSSKSNLGNRSRLSTILCIRPNNFSSIKSVDRHRVKLQTRSLFLPDRLSPRWIECVTFMDRSISREHYLPTIYASHSEQHQTVLSSLRLVRGRGLHSVRVTYPAWRLAQTCATLIDLKEYRLSCYESSKCELCSFRSLRSLAMSLDLL